MRNPKLLITGSKGVIGKILTEALSDSFEVYGLDVRGDVSEKDYIGDISRYEELDGVFKTIVGIEATIHLAADPRLGASWESILNNNIIGTRNVYECARKYGVRKVVFASSNHVTGAYEGLPPMMHKLANPHKISASAPVRPDSDYGSSKIYGEAVARQYLELHGIKSVCLRIGKVIEDDDPTKDERNMKVWLSHRDLIQLVKKSILSDIGFAIYYGVSNNRGMFWDISNAEEEIGYRPQDDASLLR